MTQLRLLLVLLLVAGLSSCNRAGARIPGASGAFHPSRTGYVAKQTNPRALRLEMPTDSRTQYFGKRVANTKWTACRTDPFRGGSASKLLATEIERELNESRLYREINPPDDPSALVLETDIRAMCAQAIGFLFIRVAGITSLHFKLRDGNAVLYEKTIERVVTDAEDEYTGPRAGFIEQVMKILISDSVREVFRELIPSLEAANLSAGLPTEPNFAKGILASRHPPHNKRMQTDEP